MLVGGILGGQGVADITLDGCSNSGAITIENEQAHNTSFGYIGGLLGNAVTAGTLTVTFTGCTNSGNIELLNTTFDTMFGLGGICGQLAYSSDAELDVPEYYANYVFENCTNEGDILVKNSKSVAYHSSIAGFIAASTADGTTLTITNPVQNGDITVTDDSDEGFSQGIQVGGIVAWAKHGTITNTDNNRGTVSGNFSYKAKKSGGIPYVGGIIGLAQGVTEISGIKVTSTAANPSSFSLELDSATANSYIGGLVGYTEAAALTCTNLSNAAPLNLTIPSSTGGHPYVGGCFSRNGAAINATNCSNSGDLTVRIDNHAAWGCYAGVIGYLGGASTFKDCYNTGSSVFYSTTCSQRPYLGGVVGYFDAASSMTGCYNSGNGVVETNITTLSVDAAIGGFAAWFNKAATLKNCYNAQPVNHNIGTSTKGNYIGGFVGRIAVASSLNSCYNSGAVTINPSTGYTSSYIAAAGIAGEAVAAITATNCYNTGDITLKKSKYSIVYIGSAVAYSNYTNAKGSTAGFHTFYNTGAITVEDGTTAAGNVRIGGIHAWPAKAIYDTNIHNYGDITLGVKTTKQILLGGIYGYSGTNMTMDGGYVNTGNITITETGGVSSTGSFNVAVGGIIGTYYFDVKNAINTGNITMLGTGDPAAATFGGIVGFTYPKGTIQDCKSYCTIKAIGYEGKNVGMIAAHPRTAEVVNKNTLFAVVRNCELGGAVILNTHAVDSELGDPIIIDKKITLADTQEEDTTDPANPTWKDYFYNYIYGQKSVPGSDYDGCTLLTAAPTFTRLDKQATE